MFNAKALKGIRDYLLKREETIAVAESVTSGFLQAAFSTTPDASKFFQGGITAYNLGQKYRHLHVNPIHAQNCDCVSEEVAATMALEVCHLFGSHWGVAITGYASKVPEGNRELYALYAVAHRQKQVAAGRIKALKTEGEETQLFFTDKVLTALHKKMGAGSKQKA